MIAILYYPLKYTGDGFTIKEAIIISWGGLRGALALALALIIFVTADEGDINK